MTSNGRVYKFDESNRRSQVRNSDAMRNQALDNGSTTDTHQWCELHRGHCSDVVPVRRVFESLDTGPKRKTEIFFACQKCLRDLKKAELIKESRYAGLPCAEVVVPRGFGKSRGLALEFPVRQQRIEPRQRSFEVTLDVLQVKYLRALGLKVIPV